MQVMDDDDDDDDVDDDGNDLVFYMPFNIL